jgi:AcrR family transcriptional regulator
MSAIHAKSRAMATLSRTEPRPAHKRASRLDRILGIAARMMNELGPGGLRLGLIAEELGCSRNALYYYVRDRHDLVGLCYRHTCTLVADTIAATPSKAPDERIESIVGALLGRYAEQPFAVISDAAMLAEADRSEIEQQVAANTTALARIIEEGIANGIFRPRDANLCAQMILGMVNWAILWNRWIITDGEVLPAVYRSAAITIADIALNGITVPGGADFRCPEGLPSKIRTLLASAGVSGRSGAAPGLLETASRLFNRYGPESVSLDEIAAQIGLTKGAIYHHFADKRALLVAAHERAFDLQHGFVDLADAEPVSDRERMLCVFYANCLAHATEAPPVALHPGLNALPPSILERASQSAKRMRRMHARALREPQMRPADASIVELTAGAFFWLQTWRCQRLDLSPEAIAAEMSGIVATGLRTPR